jgi:hypothetical protein
MAMSGTDVSTASLTINDDIGGGVNGSGVGVGVGVGVGGGGGGGGGVGVGVGGGGGVGGGKFDFFSSPHDPRGASATHHSGFTSMLIRTDSAAQVSQYSQQRFHSFPLLSALITPMCLPLTLITAALPPFASIPAVRALS